MAATANLHLIKNDEIHTIITLTVVIMTELTKIINHSMILCEELGCHCAEIKPTEPDTVNTGEGISFTR